MPWLSPRGEPRNFWEAVTRDLVSYRGMMKSGICALIIVKCRQMIDTHKDAKSQVCFQLLSCNLLPSVVLLIPHDLFGIQITLLNNGVDEWMCKHEVEYLWWWLRDCNRMANRWCEVTDCGVLQCTWPIQVSVKVRRSERGVGRSYIMLLIVLILLLIVIILFQIIQVIKFIGIIG